MVKALQTFWKKKLRHENTGLLSYPDEGLIRYAVEPVTDPPFMCYVTLPNGCCFGNLLLVSMHLFLADRTATQYDRLLPAGFCPSVCLSVCKAVHCGSHGWCTRLKLIPVCS